jgi:hypothetical protein
MSMNVPLVHKLLAPHVVEGADLARVRLRVDDVLRSIRIGWISTLAVALVVRAIEGSRDLERTFAHPPTVCDAVFVRGVVGRKQRL